MLIRKFKYQKALFMSAFCSTSFAKAVSLNNSYKRVLLLFISLTLIYSCKKDGLTKATQNGANTFSCKINGQAFQPCEGQGLFTSKPLFGSVTFDASATAFILAKCNKSYPNKYVTIELDDFKGIGEYSLSASDNECAYKEKVPDKTYSSFYTRKGKVVVTKDDRTNYILSGTLEFTAANKDSTNDVISVTDGRFDISYK